MQTNQLHDFAGRGHGDLGSTLWGYLRHRTLGAEVLLPPTLEGLLPFLGFVALGFLHRDPSPARRHRPCDASGVHVAVSLHLPRSWQRLVVSWSFPGAA